MYVRICVGARGCLVMYNILKGIIPTNEVLRKVIKKKELRTMNTVSFESPVFRVLKLRH